MPHSAKIPEAWRARIDALLASGGRVILGLAGPPGAGKSSAAEAIVASYGETAVLVPMDGYHLANVELARLSRAARKGAPDTFDAGGYAALLARIRAEQDETVYAPLFRREIEEPIAGAIPVLPRHRLVVTEGNYLLFETGAWARVRPLLDACWYVGIDDATRTERLLARHIRFGRDAAAAWEWVQTTDEPNARAIAATARRADLKIAWPPT